MSKFQELLSTVKSKVCEKKGADYLQEMDLFSEELRSLLSDDDYSRLSKLMQQQDRIIGKGSSLSAERWLEDVTASFDEVEDFIQSEKDLYEILSEELDPTKSDIKLYPIVGEIVNILSKIKG